MADGVSSFAPTPFVSRSSAPGTQKIAPSVLDLGSYYLTRNVRAEALGRVFARPSSGTVFAGIDGFLAVATANNLDFGEKDGSAAAKNSANAAYTAALDLFTKRETPAEAHLRELLQAPAPKSAPPAAAASTLKLATNTAGELGEGETLTLTLEHLSAMADGATNSNITYNITGGPVNGHLELASDPGAAVVAFTQAQIASGLVRYVHNGTNSATDSFSFNVRSGNDTLSASFRLLITPADDSPILRVNTGASVDEGFSTLITTTQLSATDVDTSSANITYNLTAGPAHGRLELTTNPGTAITSFTQSELAAGRLRFVHDGSETASDSFTFTLSDETTTTAAATFNITVNPLNDAPQLTNTGATAQEGATLALDTGSLSASDADTGDSSLVFTVTSAPANGYLQLSGNPGNAITSFTQADLAAGLVQYVNDGSENASDSFGFSLSDGSTTLNDTFSIAINPVDDAPVITANTGATAGEGGSTLITTAQLNATDVDTASGSLVYTVTAAPANGYLELTTNAGVAITSFTQSDLEAGIVNYVHDGSETSSDSFAFTLADDTTTLAEATFNLTINPVNDAPQLENNGTTVTEGGATTLTTANLNATDADTADSGLVYTLTSTPANGRLELSTNPGAAITSFTQADLASGLVRYVHDGSEAASDSFSFDLTDGTTTLSGNTFNITVSPVDDAPVLAVNAGVTVTEGSSTLITTSQLSATDVDTANANLLYTVTSAPANGYLELTTNAGVSITSFTQADLAAGIVNYVHDGSEAALDNFTFQLSDQTTTLGAAAFNITVNPVDDAPQLVNTGATVTEGSSAIITTSQLNATDADTPDASLVYTVTAAPAAGYLELTTNAGVAITSFTQSDLAAGIVNYVHNGSEASTDSFTFSLSDGTTALSGNTFNITVSPVDDAPVLAANAPATANEGSTVTLTTANLNTTDVDTANYNLTYTLTSNPSNGYLQYNTSPGTAITSFTQADLQAGLVEYVHNGSETTSDSFTFIVADLTTTLSAATFSINVNPVNDAPVITNNGASVTEGSSTIITTAKLTASDPDTANVNLVYTVNTAPAHGRLELTTSPGVSITSFTQADLAAGRVRYVHDASEPAADSFTFTLSDGANTLSGNTFNITVNPVDDPPVLNTNLGAVVSRIVGSTTITSLQLSASDPDTATANIIFTVTGGLTKGYLDLTTNPGTAITSFTQADIDAGRVRYVHTSGGLSADSFTFTVRDATTTLAAATFNITVIP